MKTLVVPQSFTTGRYRQCLGVATFILMLCGAPSSDRIFKGTKAAELPIERPMKFELAFNLKTAKQIGLTIPPNVLGRANRVIK